MHWLAYIITKWDNHHNMLKWYCTRKIFFFFIYIFCQLQSVCSIRFFKFFFHNVILSKIIFFSRSTIFFCLYRISSKSLYILVSMVQVFSQRFFRFASICFHFFLLFIYLFFFFWLKFFSNFHGYKWLEISTNKMWIFYFLFPDTSPLCMVMC